MTATPTSLSRTAHMTADLGGEGDPAGQRVGGLFRKNRRRRDRGGASRLVAAMKLFLPAAALVLVALIVLWPQLLPDRTNFRLGDSTVDLSDSDGLRMEKPRYVGVDQKDRPYELMAAMASQETEDSRFVQLRAPKADLTTQSGAWAAVSAENGTYDREGHTVDLRDQVTVFYDTGYVISTDRALVDLNAGQVISPTPVVGNGPAGIAEGEGMRIDENGARVLFTGRSRVVVDPRAARSGG